MAAAADALDDGIGGYDGGVVKGGILYLPLLYILDGGRSIGKSVVLPEIQGTREDRRVPSDAAPYYFPGLDRDGRDQVLQHAADRGLRDYIGAAPVPA